MKYRTPRSRANVFGGVLAIALAALAAVAGPGTTAAAAEEVCPANTRQGEGLVPFYRLYSAGAGDHFYTADRSECLSATTAGYAYERLQGYVFPAGSSNGIPLWRAYAPWPWQSDHFYTVDYGEYQTAQTSYHYRPEGVAANVYYWNATAGVPLYRLYSGQIGDHLYTTSLFEALSASRNGYAFEGVCCRIVP